MEPRAPRILVVEDEAVLRLLLTEVLQNEGFDVVEAGSGDEAVLIIEGSDKAMDLVFTDIRMPGKLDGFQLALWLREKYPTIPVFLTSGDTGTTQPDYELTAGQPFFRKPYDMDIVLDWIRGVLA